MEACADILDVFLKIFNGELKAKRYSGELITSMIEAFKPDCNLHRDAFQISEEELINLTTKHQEWRNELKVGDKVDVHVHMKNKKLV